MNDRMKKTLGIVSAGLITAAVLAAEANKIVVDGSTTVGPLAKAFAEYCMAKNPGTAVSVSESGSGNGAKSLMNGVCDVASMSRPMKPAEIKAAKDSGVLPIEHVVAMDGIVVVVHPGSPVANLTVVQLRDVYAGKIANWKTLGGPDRPIVVISRDTNSGTYETFESLVMNKTKMGERVEYVGSNGAIRQRVMSTPAAIGYVGLAFTEGIKALTVDDVEATSENVAAKKYPLARPLYFYTNGRPKEGTALADFIGFARTADGKRMIEEIGFVPVP